MQRIGFGFVVAVAACGGSAKRSVAPTATAPGGATSTTPSLDTSPSPTTPVTTPEATTPMTEQPPPKKKKEKKALESAPSRDKRPVGGDVGADPCEGGE